MENLKEGNYIRAGAYGFARIVKIIKDLKTLKPKAIKDEKGMIITINYIQKADKDFIKLLELGDYINGVKLTHEYFFEGVLYRDSNNAKQYDKLVKMKMQEIKDALTHEQYEKKCYKFNN